MIGSHKTLLYVARGRAWNSLDTTEQTLLWYVITLITPDTHRPSYAIAMVVDALVSNKPQAISNHHSGVIMVVLRVKGIISCLLNNVRERSTGWPPASFFVIDGFASDNDNVMFKICQ